tara:strand:- start:344 stop:940 length:597 start_codon:yes stop_codon:yes gene_type:complete
MTEYEIIGGDGKEYGPYPAEKIRGLLRENRLKPYSKIRPTQGNWTTVEALPEFAQPPVTESGPPPVQPTTAGAAPYNPQLYAAPAGPVPQEGPPNNQLAVTGLVLGISSLVLGCCCGRIPILGFFATLVSFVTPIAGIICSCIARKQIRESNGTQGGDGMAMTGLICSGVYLLMIAAIIVLVVLGIASAAALGGLSGP